MISTYEMRQISRRYVRDALQASGLNTDDFASACRIKCAKQMRDYIAGVVCPTVDRMLLMHKASGIRPDDYGLPLLKCNALTEEMRQGIRNGHAQAEFVKATQCDKNIINALVNGNGVTLASVMKFVEAWEKYNVPALISDPEFAASTIRKAPKTRSEKEHHWIERVWGGLAESAKQIRNGFWIWFSDSIYRLELELISDDLYEFRGIVNSTGEISTRREVHIA